jgi:nucleotide-binding universal stress UspA family protein
MFKQILVGVDGKDGGRDAIALAKRLSETDSRITLGYVFMAYPDVYVDAYTPLLQEDAARLLSRARDEAGLDADIAYVGSRSAGVGLHRLAVSGNADLLVVGSSSRGLLGRVLVGDDTRAALQGAPCAIAIAPTGYLSASRPIEAVGVGYDGAQESLHALEFSKALADELGARVSAFTAVTVADTTFTPGPLPMSDVIDALVEQALDEITARGVEAHAGYGRAAERLTEYSTALDLLVIGSRGEGLIGRLMHGSTAQALADTAHCPLLILPRSAGCDEEPGGDHLSGRVGDGERQPLPPPVSQ